MVDKFCYLGDMLSQEGDCEHAILKRIQTGWLKLRKLSRMLIGKGKKRDELPWPSGYELRLSLERSRVLILVKVIGGRQEGHPVQKRSLLQQKSQRTIGHHPSPVKTGSV